MTFSEPAPAAAWRHRDVREGFEVVHFQPMDQPVDGHRIDGSTSAVEAGQAWVVSYTITLESWTTRSARITARSTSGTRHVAIDTDGRGTWRVDGAPADHLSGCLDVDLESSAMTNAFPVHRLALSVGDQASAPAAYVRAEDLSVERLEQHYTRTPDDEAGHHCYDYVAPAFDVAVRLVYDGSGLVLDYPGIAVRAA